MRPGWERRPDPAKNPRRVVSQGSLSPALVVLSKRIRRLYAEDRSIYETLRSGVEFVYIVPRRYDGEIAIEPEQKGTPSIWLCLAEWMLANEVDPDRYIHEAMEYCDQKGAPEPYQLMTEWRLEEYRQSDDLVDLAGALTFQVELCSTKISNAVTLAGMSKNLACAFTLTDDSLELSALFRYCIACSMSGEKFKLIATQYEQDAVVQYWHRRDRYRKYWSRILPAGYDRQAQILYRRLVGRERGDHGC